MQGLVMPGLTGVTPIELVLPQLSGLSAEELSQIYIPSEDLVLERRFACGAFNEVWAGKLGGSKAVAVKTVALDGMTPDHADILKRETEVVVKVCRNCQHVCRYEGLTVKDGKFCIVMKLYVCSLAARIQRGDSPAPRSTSQAAAAAAAAAATAPSPAAAAAATRLSLETSLKYAVDIARSLAELHQQGVVCCDVKPDNVLIDEQDAAVICDFGLSRVLSQSHPSRSAAGGAASGFVLSYALGTWNYMAPEQYDSELNGPIGKKCDVWGFGCTVLHMLCGAPPWAGMNIGRISLLVGAKKRSPEIPSGLPRPLAGLLRRCLRPNPAARPTAEQLLTQLTKMQRAAAAKAERQSAAAAATRPQPSSASASTATLISSPIQSMQRAFASLVMHQAADTLSIGGGGGSTSRHHPLQPPSSSSPSASSNASPTSAQREAAAPAAAAEASTRTSLPPASPTKPAVASAVLPAGAAALNSAAAVAAAPLTSALAPVTSSSSGDAAAGGPPAGGAAPAPAPLRPPHRLPALDLRLLGVEPSSAPAAAGGGGMAPAFATTAAAAPAPPHASSAAGRAGAGNADSGSTDEYPDDWEEETSLGGSEGDEEWRLQEAVAAADDEAAAAAAVARVAAAGRPDPAAQPAPGAAAAAPVLSNSAAAAAAVSAALDAGLDNGSGNTEVEQVASCWLELLLHVAQEGQAKQRLVLGELSGGWRTLSADEGALSALVSVGAVEALVGVLAAVSTTSAALAIFALSCVKDLVERAGQQACVARAGGIGALVSVVNVAASVRRSVGNGGAAIAATTGCEEQSSNEQREAEDTEVMESALRIMARLLLSNRAHHLLFVADGGAAAVARVLNSHRSTEAAVKAALQCLACIMDPRAELLLDEHDDRQLLQPLLSYASASKSPPATPTSPTQQHVMRTQQGSPKTSPPPGRPQSSSSQASPAAIAAAAAMPGIAVIGAVVRSGLVPLLAQSLKCGKPELGLHATTALLGMVTDVEAFKVMAQVGMARLVLRLLSRGLPPPAPPHAPAAMQPQPRPQPAPAPRGRSAAAPQRAPQHFAPPPPPPPVAAVAAVAPRPVLIAIEQPDAEMSLGFANATTVAAALSSEQHQPGGGVSQSGAWISCEGPTGAAVVRKLEARAGLLLQALCARSDVRRQLADSSGIDQLMALLQHPHPRVVESCLLSLRHFCRLPNSACSSPAGPPQGAAGAAAGASAGRGSIGDDAFSTRALVQPPRFNTQQQRLIILGLPGHAQWLRDAATDARVADAAGLLLDECTWLPDVSRQQRESEGAVGEYESNLSRRLAAMPPPYVEPYFSPSTGRVPTGRPSGEFSRSRQSGEYVRASGEYVRSSAASDALAALGGGGGGGGGGIQEAGVWDFRLIPPPPLPPPGAAALHAAHPQQLQQSVNSGHADLPAVPASPPPLTSRNPVVAPDALVPVLAPSVATASVATNGFNRPPQPQHHHYHHHGPRDFSAMMSGLAAGGSQALEAATTLVGIEEWSDDSISHFVDCGCLPAVAELLCCTDRQVLAIVMSGLQFLAARDPTHRLLIANCAGVQSGLPLLLEHRDPHIVESALELIQAVAADSDFL